MDEKIDDIDKGIHALKITWVILIATSLFQAVIVYFSSSAALLGDTLHNLADAFTALPLWLAFSLERRKPNQRYTYGYSRFEDLAGVCIVLFIFGTAVLVGYESWQKLQARTVPQRLPLVVLASIVGFIGNEWVARYRMRVGREINSNALIADGHHARADSITSLGVLVGVAGVYFGWPLADSLIGFVISLAILHIAWHTGKEMFARLADAVSPEMVGAISETAKTVKEVLSVYDIRARYVGRHLRVEVTIEVDGGMTVLQGHEIAIEVQHALQQKFPMLVSPAIHVDPEGHEGEGHHFEAHHHPKK